MTPQEIASWKAPEDRTGADDPALKFPPKDETAGDKAADQDKAAKPKKARKPSAPKAKGKKGRLGVMLGWFIETVPVFQNEDGTLGSDMSKRVNIPVPNAKGVNDAMKKFRELAATSPESVSNHCVRIVKVEKVFTTKVRQIVDIEE